MTDRRHKPRAKRAREEGGDATAVWRHSRDVVSRRLGDQVVLVNVRTDEAYTLNSTAGHLWQQLGRGGTIARIRRSMLRQFEVGEARLDRELRGILRELCDAGLVHRTRGLRARAKT